MQPKGSRALFVFVALSLGSLSAARAQPGSTAPATPVSLTPSERALVARGEISRERHVLGVVGSVVPGLGLGQVIEGRWLERGWIFTFGVPAGLVIASIAASDFDLDENVAAAMYIVGGGGALVLKVWEVVDAIRGPSLHNRRVRAIRAKAGFDRRDARVTLQPFLLLHGESGGRGGIAGLTLRF
jgi:hypothetical protein